MTISSAALRAAIPLVNAAGRALGRTGLPLVTLDEDAVLTAARRQTGLRDFGGEEFRDALRLLLQAPGPHPLSAHPVARGLGLPGWSVYAGHVLGRAPASPLSEPR